MADRACWRRIERLAGDASTRVYTRLENRDGQSWILSEYPGESRRLLGRDLEVLRWAVDSGIRVPAVIEHDLAAGWALLEDLGPVDAAAVLASAPAAEQRRLLEASLEALVTLAGIEIDQLPPWNAPLDRTRLRWELAGFELWFVRHWRGRTPDPRLGQRLDRLAEDIGSHPRRVCHRDYHLNNLFVLAGGEIAVIDIQDILVGPDSYDAVSLLAERDTPRLVDPVLAREWLELWASSTGAAPGWQQRWPLVRLQRGLKVLGTFARLTLGGSSDYRHWMEALAAELAAASEIEDLPGELRSILVD
jgi:aminoglycoside/choline kinase family phosphotransferase